MHRSHTSHPYRSLNSQLGRPASAEESQQITDCLDGKMAAAEAEAQQAAAAAEQRRRAEAEERQRQQQQKQPQQQHRGIFRPEELERRGHGHNGSGVCGGGGFDDAPVGGGRGNGMGGVSE